MAFFPYERLTITTGLNADAVCTALAGVSEAKRYLRNPFSRTHRRYQGQVTTTGFKLTRIIHHRNSFLPIIKGEYAPLVNGTQVVVTMSLHPFVIVFMSFWLSSAAAGIVLGLRQWASGAAQPVLLAPLGMFIFGYLLCTLSFKWETRKERQFFAELLTGQRTA